MTCTPSRRRPSSSCKHTPKQVDRALTFHKSDGERAASEVAEFTVWPRASLLNKLTSAAAKIFRRSKGQTC